MVRTVGTICLVLSGILLALNALAFLPRNWFEADPAQRFSVRDNDSVISAAEAERRLASARGEGESAYIEGVMRAVNQRMTNVQNAFVENDGAMRPSLVDNWLLALLNDGRFDNYEYQSVRLALRRGLGTCGAQSITFAKIVEREGYRTWLWASDWHVTVLAQAPSGAFYAVDPDYGVVISGRDTSPGLVNRLYRDALQRPPSRDMVAIRAHYAHRPLRFDDPYMLAGIRYDDDEFYGLQPQSFEALLEALSWAAPALLLTLGFLLMRLRTRASAPSRRVTAVTSG